MEQIRKLFSLEGVRVIVTGGSGGLGLNMAQMLADCGALVISLSRSVVKEPGEMEKRDNLAFDRLDITIEEDVCRKINEIGRRGGIDVLINNAGVNLRSKAQELNRKDWEYVFNVNIHGMYYCCKCAYPYLKASTHPGRIINISSMASHLGFTEVAPYAASKSAVLGLTRTLAVEWAGENILVNSVSPGWFPSDLNREVVDDERERKILNRIPLGRYGNPEELSAFICFLASPSATYMSGEDFSIDGGALSFGY